MLLDGINILVQYLENTIKVVPHNLKVPNIFQVITSRNKKVFHSVVHIFTKSSGKTCLEFRLPKGCQTKKKEKNNDSGCIWTSGHGVTFLLAPFKTPNPLIFKMFPAGSQVVLYLLPFTLFLVKYLSVFIFFTVFRKCLFNPVTCAAFILYSKVSNSRVVMYGRVLLIRFINIQGKGSKHSFSASSRLLYSCAMVEIIILTILNNYENWTGKTICMGSWKLIGYPEIRSTEWRMDPENRTLEFCS